MVVVVGEVAGDILSGESAVVVFGHFEFGLDGSEARFHEGVIVWIISTAHALQHFFVADYFSEIIAAVLPASV